MKELFDAELALEQAGGNEVLARDLLQMLLNDLAAERATIAAAFRQAREEGADIPPLWDAVHKLYGATAYLGVPGLRKAAKAFEDDIKQDRRERFAQRFEQLDAEIEKLQEAGPELLRRAW